MAKNRAEITNQLAEMSKRATVLEVYSKLSASLKALQPGEGLTCSISLYLSSVNDLELSVARQRRILVLGYKMASEWGWGFLCEEGVG